MPHKAQKVKSHQTFHNFLNRKKNEEAIVQVFKKNPEENIALTETKVIRDRFHNTVVVFYMNQSGEHIVSGLKLESLLELLKVPTRSKTPAKVVEQIQMSESNRVNEFVEDENLKIDSLQNESQE